MTKPGLEPRFPINPVEYLILATVAGLLIGSLYSLLYNVDGFQFTALTRMNSSPVSAVTEDRLPATAIGVEKIDLQCEGTPERRTDSHRVLVSGTFCGADLGSDGENLLRTTAVNVSKLESGKPYAGTVVTDIKPGRFYTDFIPLVSGKNTIHLEFTYRNGKIVSHDVNVVRN